MQFLLTPKAIEAAIKKSETGPDETLADTAARGSGKLLLRARMGKGTWQFRFSPAPGKDDKLALGHYARAAGKGGLTLAEARSEAARLGALLRDPATRDLRAHHARQEQARHDAEQARHAAAAIVERAKLAAAEHTLAALLAIYVEHLRTRGKVSAESVATYIERHVLRARPALAAKPARNVDRKDIAGLVRGIVEQGTPRTAGLLRAYVSAAYRLAISAEGDPLAPAALIPFEIQHNPVDGVKALPIATRDRALTSTELRLALGHMAVSDSVCAHLLRACVMGGGQRPQQMARARVPDFDPAGGTLLLWDGKGRRKEPRPHLLPLGPETQAHIVAMVERAGKLGTDLLFTDDGTAPVQLTSLARWVRELNRKMMRSREVSASFQAKDLRRTAETLQAKHGFGKDLRAQLLSHGLGGIQSARYDRHDYLDEKRDALLRWEALLRGVPSDGENLIQIRRTG